LNVAVLTGGRSLERQVSLRSGARVADALERNGHSVVTLDLGPDLVQRLQDDVPDAVFVAVHGEQGEDGTLQELLEILGLPYTGPGPAATRRCWDKAIAKEALEEAGIPTPAFMSFSQAAFSELGAGRALGSVAERLEFPVVVKPASQGSALGVRFAQGAENLPSALLAAFSYDDRVVLERYIAGRDLAVSVIESAEGPLALPVVEAVPHEDHFFDFEARYSIGTTSYACPAPLEEPAALELRELAGRVYERFGCRGVARVDVMLEAATSRPFVLEVNAVPGFTETSLLPMAAEAAGITFDELVERLLERAVARASAEVDGQAPAAETHGSRR
jgi:D-alanine-D-alanine ligase